MSIIERVVELLGSVPQAPQKPSAPGGERGIPEPVLIERAVSERNERSEFRTASQHAPQPDAVDFLVESKAKARRARSASTITPTVTIDLDRLRRQSMITPDSDRTPIAEAFRRIKRQILLNISQFKPGTQPSLVMITSSLMGEGKTFCAINLALSISSERDYSVVLVDADVTRSSIPETLGLKVRRGWMDVLLDGGINLADVLCKTNIERLMFLPAGTPHRNVTELVSSGAMGMLLGELSAGDPNRVIIFDSPPLLAASEAVVLAGQMGQIVVVVEAGVTSEAVVKSALGRIEANNVIGLILNKGEPFGSAEGYGTYEYDAK